MIKPRAPTTHWRQALLLTVAGMACGAALVTLLDQNLVTAPPPPQWPPQAAPTLALPALPLAMPARPGPPPETVAPPEPPARQAVTADHEARLHQHWESARQALRQRAPDTAREFLAALLREHPGHAPSLRALALLDSHQGADEHARDRHRQAAVGTGETPESQAMGWLADNIQDAPRMLRLLATLYPDSPGLHFAEGVAHGQQANWTAAAQAFEKSLHHAADAPDTWYNLAIAQDRQGRSAAAATAYREALRHAQAQPHRFPLEQAGQRLARLTTGGAR